jgi:hypothetical protein
MDQESGVLTPETPVRQMNGHKNAKKVNLSHPKETLVE